ncbi:MAG: adenylate/guanylate cyclase domain-containing protein [Nitrosomonadales bacterium]|nr:adenylate/guanylate cyclase domain-containing protein [Nitrosomonadales bacterium]
MEDRGNKTIMCSVLFLDIVEYSKKSVAGQISLKDRFNSYLSTAIRDVPMTDRIILDTGDGAAINFLGDVEDALKAALSLRESLLNEAPDLDQPLLIRMGINLGPVRLVRDINGQPNIVGDGINVAQRVMGFADASQILVSRSYYDAVSRLSPRYAEMFHYQGSRTDKHVREHEVYAIGYPGDKTTQRVVKEQPVVEPTGSWMAVAFERSGKAWRSAADRLDELLQHSITCFKEADSKRRALYIIAIVAPLVIVALLLKLTYSTGGEVKGSAGLGAQAVLNQPASAVASVPSHQATSSVVATSPTPKIASSVAAAPAHPAASAVAAPKTTDKTKEKTESAGAVAHGKPKGAAETKRESAASRSDSPAILVVECTDGAWVHIDGWQKGRISSGQFTITMKPGKYLVGISDMSLGKIYSQDVTLLAGRTTRVNPSFCH